MTAVIDVVTPVCNRCDLTQQFLMQHWHRYEGGSVRWIVIDNGSTDNTPGILRRWQSDDHMGNSLVVKRNNRNEGFSRACNQGARLDPRRPGENRLVVFVNNDVILKGDYLTKIMASLANNPRDLVGAQLLDQPTGWNMFGQTLVSYLGGWCLGMDYQTYEELGGFDERYTPADYEDMDMCYLAMFQNRELIQLDLPIDHMSEQTAVAVLPGRREITIRNRARFASKWGLPDDPKK